MPTYEWDISDCYYCCPSPSPSPSGSQSGSGSGGSSSGGSSGGSGSGGSGSSSGGSSGSGSSGSGSGSSGSSGGSGGSSGGSGGSSGGGGGSSSSSSSSSSGSSSSSSSSESPCAPCSTCDGDMPCHLKVEIEGWGSSDGVYQLQQGGNGCGLTYDDGTVSISLLPHKIHGQQIWRVEGTVQVGTNSMGYTSAGQSSRSCAAIFAAGEIPPNWTGDPHKLTIL